MEDNVKKESWDYREVAERLMDKVQYLEIKEQDARLRAIAYEEVLQSISAVNPLTNEPVHDIWGAIAKAIDVLERYPTPLDSEQENLQYFVVANDESTLPVNTYEEGLVLAEGVRREIQESGNFVAGVTEVALYNYSVEKDFSTLVTKWVLTEIDKITDDGTKYKDYNWLVHGE